MYSINKYAYLETHLTSNTTTRLKPAILILPGGSYVFTSPREGEPVAKAFNAKGVHAFVLHYTSYDKSKDFTIDSLLDEVKIALAYIKENAREFQVDLDNIFLVGFSAGGHLAATVANKYPTDFKKVILAYPGLHILPNKEKLDSHEKFIFNLFSQDPTVEVTSNNPPTFIWHTGEDDIVPIIDSINYIKKLNELGVRYEAHFYEKGAHGLSLATNISAEEDGRRVNQHAASWFELAVSWLLENN